jgi:hypothetical protein
VTRQEREEYEPEEIGLKGFGVWLGGRGRAVDRDALTFIKKWRGPLIDGFKSTQAEQRLFITQTVGDQKRRGCMAGICDVADDMQIDTDKGPVKRTVLRFYDDNKGEGGYITLGLLNGLRLFPLSKLQGIIRQNPIVRVRTTDRFTNEERQYDGALIGHRNEKWQAIVYATPGKLLGVHNINIGPRTGPEVERKLCDFSKHLPIGNAAKEKLRAQLMRCAEANGERITASSQASHQFFNKPRPRSVISRKRERNAGARYLTRSTRLEVTLKNVEDLAYRIHNRTVKATREHNKLQNRLYEYLVRKFGVKKVRMEQNRVDIEVRDGNNVTLYELKPFANPLLCIREALGQILLYGWQCSSESGVNLKLTIVGPSALADEEKGFLLYLGRQFGNKVEYVAVDELI